MRATAAAVVGAGLVIDLAACDAHQPLRVQDPDVASPGTATGAGALPILSAGMLADFLVSYMGAADQSNNAHEGIANLGGIFTDEFNDYDTFPTRNELNERLALPDNLTLTEVFENLGAVHGDARRALAQYAQYGPNSGGQSEAYSIDAYIYILVAEHWCSGEPFSILNVATGQIINSPFLTTAQMLDTALAEFAHAKQIALTDTITADQPNLPTLVGLATVGEARALLDLGQVALAADTARTVASGFQYLIYASTNTLRQENGVWNYTINGQEFSVADVKNGTGLPFVSANDPRVPSILSASPGTNGQGPFYNQQKYPTSTSNMVLADYTEAQLIAAEGDIAVNNNYPGARSIMNALRANVPGLAPVADSSGASPKGQMQQLLYERAFWMYVTGHRLGDWRRMLRPPYNAAPFSFVTSDVYPVGTGLQPTLEFPTPSETNSNPNYQACDPTIP
jgi:hypothetical protein